MHCAEGPATEIFTTKKPQKKYNGSIKGKGRIATRLEITGIVPQMLKKEEGERRRERNARYRWGMERGKSGLGDLGDLQN